MLAGCVTAQKSLVGFDRVLRGGRVFVEQFDAEIAQPCGSERFEIAGASLRTAIEERVPAANICFEGVELADAISQLNFVLFAGPAAVFVTRPVTQERAEGAVLHVKHRHVLMNRHF